MRIALLFTAVCTVSLLYYNQAFRTVNDMGWGDDPRSAWKRLDPIDQKILIILLNQRNYNDNDLEKVFIATGVLLDNSRVLTSYTPFKDLLHSTYYTDNLLVLIPVGALNETVDIKIANVVCGRQLVTLDDDLLNLWTNISIPHVPVHDLMVFRIEEEIGMSSSSSKKPPYSEFNDKLNFSWNGPGDWSYNALYAVPAQTGDTIMESDYRICGLGYRDKDEIYNNSIIIATSSDDAKDESNEDAGKGDLTRAGDYGADYGGGGDGGDGGGGGEGGGEGGAGTNTEGEQKDDSNNFDVNCEKWMPREWGRFICLSNTKEYTGITNGALLFSANKLFGIGAFTLYRNQSSILVFTDVRHYTELIQKTCGNSEIKKDEE